MTAIVLEDLTTGAVDGDGVFDKLMSATKAHLEVEFRKGAIKGTEYAQVYLGQVQQVLQTAVQYINLQQKSDLESQLLEQQVLLAKAQVEQTQAQVELTQQQTLNAAAQKLQIEAQTDLITEQKANEILQGKVLVAQECLLRAQYDGTLQTTLKSSAETDLLKQKIVTEKAQTLELGVDTNSVIGRQKELYAKQSAGFDRDAEQKAVKIWTDTWNARRMTDDGTVADGVNMLADTTGGRLMNKLLTGIGA
jgi:hypothetical protein